MVQPTTPLVISRESQRGILEFEKQCFNMLNQQWNLREQMRSVDLKYQREVDYTKENQRAKAANKAGDPTRYQNYIIPVILPQVENAVSYQSSVFLQGDPLFDVVASPQYEDQALQLSAVIEENSVRGGWKRELQLFFRDGFKYNLSAMEVTWGREVTAAFETDLQFSASQAKPKEVTWEGNIIKRMDMYNTFFDSRVKPTEVHTKGEFAGYTEVYSRIALKDFIAKLPDKMVDNIKEAFESSYAYTGAGSGGIGGIQDYYIPDINPNAILDKNLRNNMNWMQWVGITDNQSKIQYKNMYQVTVLYARILPTDFKLRVPRPNTPQIWKFIIVNHQVVIYAERLTNAHGYLPIIFAQPNEDGLSYQTKSLANNVEPIQDISSALMNSALAARRRAISDRGLYDPSRVSEANINSANPSAKIPVRPAAYGKPLSDAYYPIPFRDDQSGISIQQIGLLGNYANSISGQNPAKQGQFVKGNKTLHEYEDVMSHANGRDQMTAQLYEAQFFTPFKIILKSNTLQFQTAGTYYSDAQNRDVSIDPVQLRNALVEFKVSDGLTPTDKLISSDDWITALQTIGSSPAIGQAYNIGPLFSYLMKTRHVNLKPFEKPAAQVTYEQAAAQWQAVVEAGMKQGIDPSKLPPQPTPQQFGWDPQATADGKEQQAQQRN